jgi:hypothetical protein
MICMLGCQQDEANIPDSTMKPPPSVMIVDEVCKTTQGFYTEGWTVTVRGSLNATAIGSYALFDSQWDPFEPDAGKDISRITINFREGEKPDDQLDWYVDITGIIATTELEDGTILVSLDDSIIEPIPVGEGEEMKPRKKKPNKSEQATPRKPSD